MQSPLQSHFPLSPKKFWKKFLQRRLFRTVFLIGFITVVINIAREVPQVGTALLIIVGLVLLSMALHAWYIIAYIKSYYYADDDGFLTIKKGVFTPTEIHVQYNRIQDVYVDQDLWDRILGIYDVHIATATQTSGIEAHIDGVSFENAEGLKNLLLQRIKGMNTSQTSVESSAATENPIAPSMDARNEISSRVMPLTGGWVTMQIEQIISVLGIIGLMVVAMFIISGTGGNTPADLSQIPYVIIVFIGIMVIAFGSALLWKKNYYFMFAQDFFQYRTGIFTTEERHIPYSKIQDVTVSQHVFEKLFGFWTVTVENAAQQIPKSRGAVIVGLTKEQADYIAASVRSLLKQMGSTGSQL